MPTPTGNENLQGALTTGQQICWDETHGYMMGADMNPDTDCSGFVGYCLAHNGFNVPQRWNTTSMIPTLQSYPGFIEFIWQPGFQWQHGDIAVYDEGGGQHGHTFFYVENINGYLDASWEGASQNRIGALTRARMEAAGVHNHPETGDQANIFGAHTEVWIHNYSDPSTSHTWHVFRWQNAPPPPPPPIGGLPKWLLLSLINNNNRQDGGR